MIKDFIPFNRATIDVGKIFQPYKNWYEHTYISPAIAIDNAHYYLLRTSHLFSRSKLRKIVLCTKDGQLVKDPKITKQALIIYTYFHYLNAFKKDIADDCKRDRYKQFEFLIVSLEEVIENLAVQVSEAESETLNDQLVYYNEAKVLVDQISIVANKCLQVKEKLHQTGHRGVLDESTINQLQEVIYERENKRGKLEALMLRNSLKTRKLVKNILTKKSYKALIKNKENFERIVRDIDYLEYLVQHFIKVGQADWTFDEKWLGITKGDFTVEKYIDELSNENLGEIFIKTNVAIFMQEHWLFSKDSKY